jgi:glycerophosphoryl diester phosphodiesterase
MPYRLLFAENGFVHVCGHRGNSLSAPENTLPALASARAAGASLCEIDLMLSRDGELVLCHDELLDRTTDGRGPLGAQDRADLQALDAGGWFAPEFRGTRLPTLAEALAAARRLGLGLVIEIKERRRVAAAITRLAEVLAAERALDEVVIISFDHPSLLELRARLPGVRTEIITHARHADIVAVARAAQADSVSIELDMLHPDDAAALAAAGIGVRCHLPPPAWLERHAAHGLDPAAALLAALRASAISALSGDDVAFLRALLIGHGLPVPPG